MATTWLAAAIALFVALGVPLWVVTRGRLAERLVAVQLATTISIFAMVMLSFAFGRASMLDVPLMVVFLSFPGTLLLAIFLERWM